jgi:hypothetical protein
MQKELVGLIAVVAIAAAISLLFYYPFKLLLTKTFIGNVFYGGAGHFVVTRTGLVFYSMLVLVLLFSFAQIYLSPMTWFGQQMASWRWRAALFFILLVCEWVIPRGLARIGYPCLRPPNRDIDGANN